MAGGHACHQLSPSRAFPRTLSWPAASAEPALHQLGLRAEDKWGVRGLLEDSVRRWRERTRIRPSHAIAGAVTEAQRVVGE